MPSLPNLLSVPDGGSVYQTDTRISPFRVCAMKYGDSSDQPRAGTPTRACPPCIASRLDGLGTDRASDSRWQIASTEAVFG